MRGTLFQALVRTPNPNKDILFTAWYNTFYVTNIFIIQNLSYWQCFYMLRYYFWFGILSESNSIFVLLKYCIVFWLANLCILLFFILFLIKKFDQILKYLFKNSLNPLLKAFIINVLESNLFVLSSVIWRCCSIALGVKLF